MPPLIEISNLSIVIHPNQKLMEGISLTLEEGASVALMGESGLGKTTLAYALMGIESSKIELTGSIYILGRKLGDISSKEMSQIRGKEMAMIFQDPNVSLNPFFNIQFQLTEVLKVHTALSSEEIDLKLQASLKEVGLSKPHRFLKAYPHQLSGGEKQRILVAMALLCNPKILIADEPTASLDLIVKVEILKLIKNLQEKRGLALLLITHDPHIARKMADQVYEVKEGTVQIRQFAGR